MKNIFIILALSLVVVACSSLSQRYPASVDQKIDEKHDQYQGLFNR